MSRVLGGSGGIRLMTRARVRGSLFLLRREIFLISSSVVGR